MTVDDRTRLNLHRKLEEVLGHDDADTLMAHLPPVTWQDVVTKDYVDHRFDALDHRFDALDHRFDALEHRLKSELHEALARQTRWMVSFVCAWSAVLVAAATFLT